jgi:hypothetical protein
MAKAYMNTAAAEFATAWGSVQGDNKVGAGCVVELKGLGDRASGKYYVTSTFHQYIHGGYTTYFECIRPGESPLPAPRPGQAPPAQKQQGQQGGFGADVGHATQNPTDGGVDADVGDHEGAGTQNASHSQVAVADSVSGGDGGTGVGAGGRGPDSMNSSVTDKSSSGSGSSAGPNEFNIDVHES